MKSILFIVAIGLLVVSIYFATKTTKPNIIVLLGPPGGGKGTQATLLQQHTKLSQISTGDLFRKHLKEETQIGLEAKKYMNQGQLVPDSLVMDMLFDRIGQEDCKKGFILDGFPRTVPQAEELSKSLKKSHFKVIALDVPDDLIIERLTNRLVCEDCGSPFHKISLPPKIEGECDFCKGKLVQREDDSKEVVENRLKVYHTQTEPVKEYYQKRKTLTCIDATKSKDETFLQIKKSL